MQHSMDDLAGPAYPLGPAGRMPELNLAGVEGVPSPAQLTQASSPQLHEPDASLPDFLQPELQPYDLTTPGMSWHQHPLLASDPLLPDLDEYCQPDGLTLHNQSIDEIFKPDPLLAGLRHDDLPAGIVAERDAQDLDPLLPDLQLSELTPAVHMQQRPADLDANALQQLHMNPAYQALSDVPYPQVFMDQGGVNSSRRRHYDLLLSHYPEKGEA